MLDICLHWSNKHSIIHGSVNTQIVHGKVGHPLRKMRSDQSLGWWGFTEDYTAQIRDYSIRHYEDPYGPSGRMECHVRACCRSNGFKSTVALDIQTPKLRWCQTPKTAMKLRWNRPLYSKRPFKCCVFLYVTHWMVVPGHIVAWNSQCYSQHSTDNCACNSQKVKPLAFGT